MCIQQQTGEKYSSCFPQKSVSDLLYSYVVIHMLLLQKTAAFELQPMEKDHFCQQYVVTHILY